MWEKVKKFFKDSETIFWARLNVFVGAVVAFFATIMQDPNVNAALKSLVKPEYMPYYIIAFGIITELARRRRSDL